MHLKNSPHLMGSVPQLLSMWASSVKSGNRRYIDLLYGTHLSSCRDVVAEWIVCGTLNRRVTGWSPSAASGLTM